jgi:GNAT superfamily N-acetyltransferase
VRDITIAYSDRFLFAREADRAIGVMGVVPQPGGTGLVFPPEIEAIEEPEDVERRLIEAALIRLHRAGSAFAQLVLLPAEQGHAAAFERCGFVHLTDGLVLKRGLRSSPTKTDPRLVARECDPTVEVELLIGLITRINRDSLDCPELEAWRTPKQLVEGHIAATNGLRSHWTVYSADDSDMGLSIATEDHDDDAGELLYFGVVPEFRGRGYGRAILASVCMALGPNFASLNVACDARNRFAKATYGMEGFAETGRAGIWIHSLAKPR